MEPDSPAALTKCCVGADVSTRVPVRDSGEATALPEILGRTRAVLTSCTVGGLGWVAAKATTEPVGEIS